MKKTLIIAVVLALLFAAVGCTGGNEPLPKPSIKIPQPAPTPEQQPTEPVEAPPAAQGAELWNEQQWYGWWSITQSSGVYEGMDNGANWWDACATIDVAKGTMTVWDEESTPEEPIAAMQAQIVQDGTAKDCLAVGGGTFIDMPTAAKYWMLSPNGAAINNMVVFTGRYDDSANPGSFFEYIFMLRPWGTLWDDVGTNQLPYNYTSWYLPLVESGSPMPNAIG